MRFCSIAALVLCACGKSDAPRAAPVTLDTPTPVGPNATTAASALPTSKPIGTEAPSSAALAALEMLTDAGGGVGEGIGIGSTRHTSPWVRAGEVTVKGRLPPEVIQRIVRQNFARLNACYRTAWNTNPKLTGKMLIVFTIDGAGVVTTVSDLDSTLPDRTTRACVLAVVRSLSFPKPESGSAHVTYPLDFFVPDA